MKQRLRRLPVRVRRIALDTWEQMAQAQLFTVASSLAYTTILSIIPLLAVSFAIFKAFGGMERVYGVVEPFILSNLAEGVSADVIDKLHGFIENAHTSTIGVGGLVGLVFTSMSMLMSAENAIHRIWQSPNRRSLFQRVASYWLFITLGPLGGAVAIPIAWYFPGDTGIFLVTVGFFYLIYKYVPQHRIRPRYALTSAIVAALLWDLARVGYTVYARMAISRSNIYGTLSAVPILLFWIYIAWLVILSGASLTAALQHANDRAA